MGDYNVTNSFIKRKLKYILAKNTIICANARKRSLGAC
ncbi:hypothetical protein PALB_36010 [Pseudoalteromonas luteoviolacea B = ATCC 29581]|nr:hypothetical protein PALB_36010 [Pseudoalteromonas luteoviolacea B = ATCC 29581]